MKIEMHLKERFELSEFADKHGLVMEVCERTPMSMGALWNENARYYARFKNCDVLDGHFLYGRYGNGSTPDLAIANYVPEISERTLVINAGTNERQEIAVPVLTYSIKP